MNKEGRAKIQVLLDQISAIRNELEEMQGEEESKYDNMPEAIQGSEKGEKLQEIIDALGDAAGSLDDAHSALEDVIL